MMHKAQFAWAIVAALAALPIAEAAVTPYKAILRGGNERPPVATEGTGTALVNADPATKEVSWNVTFSGLSSSAVSAYIRCGARVGARGSGIAIELANGSDLQSPLTGSGKLTNVQFADLHNGRCWVNVGSASHKEGEIAGRLHR